MGMNRGNDRPILLLLLCRPPDVDVVHYGDNHDDRDDVDAAGRTIDARATVDANVESRRRRIRRLIRRLMNMQVTMTTS